jgi:hypothetical protein
VATHYKESVINGAKELGEALKYVAPKSPRDLAHLMFTLQNPSPERMAAFKEITESGDINRVVKNKLGAAPYGWTGLVGSTVVGATLVTSKSDNEKLAESFQRAHDNGFTREKTLDGMNKLKESGPPEMKDAVNMYLKLYEHLGKDGEFREQNKATMKVATHNLVEKLKAGEPVIALGVRAVVDVTVDSELALIK